MYATGGTLAKLKRRYLGEKQATYCDGNFVLFQSILEALHLETCRSLVSKVPSEEYVHRED